RPRRRLRTAGLRHRPRRRRPRRLRPPRDRGARRQEGRFLMANAFDLPYWADLVRPREDVARLTERIAAAGAAGHNADGPRADRHNLMVMIDAAEARSRGEVVKLPKPMKRRGR